MKKLFILLAAFLLLAACSEKEASSDPDVSKKEIVEEINANASKGTDPILEDKPAAEETVDKVVVFSTYRDQILSPLQNIATDLQTIQMMSRLGANDPAVLLTPTYSDAIQTVADDLRKNIVKVRAADTKNDPELQNIHNHLLQAMDELEFIANNFPIGVRNMDANLITKCKEALDRSSSYLEQATNLLTDYQSKYGL